MKEEDLISLCQTEICWQLVDFAENTKFAVLKAPSGFFKGEIRS